MIKNLPISFIQVSINKTGKFFLGTKTLQEKYFALLARMDSLVHKKASVLPSYVLFNDQLMMYVFDQDKITLVSPV